MGFCRRCGDIVSGPRCHCGGLPVAPVVSWNKVNATDEPQDKWSQTYVSKERSPSRPRTPAPTNDAAKGACSWKSSSARGDSSPKKFPRPMSSSDSTTTSRLADRVSTHIATTTASRPPSPLKQSTILPSPESDIIHSLTSQTSSLAKVYGSVLQPKESLETHSCAICSLDFPPDATIYPDPSETSSEHHRFLCRNCFITNGGSKGTCPQCTRPVLILKSEGGFVYASGRHWHKKCFNCDGCGKNLGDKPLVDLLGRPSCADCFDNCLNRTPSTPKERSALPADTTTSANPGGMMRTPKDDRVSSGSPTIDELEQRLGIVKSRESSPALEELGQRLSMLSKGRESPTRSPLARKSTIPRNEIGSPIAPSPRLGYGTETFRASASPRMLPSDGSPSLGQRFSSPERGDYWDNASKMSPARANSSPSPVRYTPTRNSPAPTEEAIEEMKQRFLRGTSMSPSLSASRSPPPVTSPPPVAPLRLASLLNSRSSPVPPSKIPRPVTVQNVDDSPSEIDSVPPTPELGSEFSDTTTQSSGLDSPPQAQANIRDDVFNSKPVSYNDPTTYSRGDFLDEDEQRGRTRRSIGQIQEDDEGTPSHTPIKRLVYDPASTQPLRKSVSSTVNSKSPPPKVTPVSSMSETQQCARCNQALFSVRAGGRYVTVPDDPGVLGSETKAYHTDCFRCYVCNEVFQESGKGQATFVKGERGPCHIQCAPPEKVTINYKMPQRVNTAFPVPTPPLKPAVRPTVSTTSPSYSSSRYERPPKTAPATQTTFPRFGSSVSCPGCRGTVSPMERGVVPGPQGTRWHSTCLVCGGKKEAKPSNSWLRGRAEERKRNEPGCGKKLDSAAKGDGEGRVWCRECWLMLPLEMRGSPQSSPMRSVVANPTGNGRIAAQMTGTTTLAKQFTGMGGADTVSLIRQMTGGGISPTRQLSRSRSPTKQLGMVDPPYRPRPKSVIGMRSTKSVDEGRGMFLVRQMTGGATAD
ncbi:hypothetical protein PLEOSDRAFT_1111438 [Pleurotus ostreatus PC15]|uniref:LIM zinc-binding domain-containing protein n=1 Tax=Pleurotus ostreatus (strain PC15) TaxID=1137138 RepID=A0A067P457_PLEO1|nr:hypothetical protein PLEOSDRAFT_1111438 [Pleurotus ostreatus PC15]